MSFLAIWMDYSVVTMPTVAQKRCGKFRLSLRGCKGGDICAQLLKRDATVVGKNPGFVKKSWGLGFGGGVNDNLGTMWKM